PPDVSKYIQEQKDKFTRTNNEWFIDYKVKLLAHKIPNSKFISIPKAGHT
ncbi:37210_t:CDS:1, partial [Gigaspora margarita]